MFGRNKYHIVLAMPGNLQPWHIQRLREYVAVYSAGEQLAEVCGIHIRRGQDGLSQIGARARRIHLRHEDLGVRYLHGSPRYKHQK
jgi:hypothetical protein